MTTLMQCSEQWMKRPADERFTDLPSMASMMRDVRENSIASVIPNRRLKFMPHPANPAKGLTIEGSNGFYDPTHWSFNQVASLAGAPASFLRKLPAAIAADSLNYMLQFDRNVQEVGVLRTRTTVPAINDEDLRMGGDPVEHVELRAATGPNYGRIWNEDIVNALMAKFGDGVTGDFRVPGEFGKAVEVSKDNTTLYASDRDMFIFLADEVNRVEMKDRRGGKGGSLAKGFFVWNSEVGSSTMGAAFFLFDYACQNRIVWGAEGYKEIRLRHTAGAPDRWMEQIAPVLSSYAQAAAGPVEETIRLAQEAKIKTDLDDFLAKRFTRSQVTAIKHAHEVEEGRPIESLWDATTGATAYAKSIPNQDDRVTIERKAGEFLDLAADW